MLPTFSPVPGAKGYQQSNPSVFATASLIGALQVFKEAGMMGPIRKWSIQLTANLESLLMQSNHFVPLHEVATRYPGDTEEEKPCTDASKIGFTIITPSDPESRGAMLSLLILPPTSSSVMESLFDALISYGLVGDKREPNVIRLTPAPLYNTIDDCRRAAACLEDAFRLLST
jgi:kynureninase